MFGFWLSVCLFECLSGYLSGSLFLSLSSPSPSLFSFSPLFLFISPPLSFLFLSSRSELFPQPRKILINSSFEALPTIYSPFLLFPFSSFASLPFPSKPNGQILASCSFPQLRSLLLRLFQTSFYCRSSLKWGEEKGGEGKARKENKGREVRGRKGLWKMKGKWMGK